jgi:hypothetical protein
LILNKYSGFSGVTSKYSFYEIKWEAESTSCKGFSSHAQDMPDNGLSLFSVRSGSSKISEE